MSVPMVDVKMVIFTVYMPLVAGEVILIKYVFHINGFLKSFFSLM